MLRANVKEWSPEDVWQTCARLRRIVRPDRDQAQLLARLGVDVPARLRARHVPGM